MASGQALSTALVDQHQFCDLPVNGVFFVLPQTTGTRFAATIAGEITS